MAPGEAANHSFWRTRNGLILAAAMLSSAIAWWMIAWPVAILANSADHPGHFVLTFAHMLGGTGMLFLGAFNLYLAARMNRFPLHRRIGQAKARSSRLVEALVRIGDPAALWAGDRVIAMAVSDPKAPISK